LGGEHQTLLPKSWVNPVCGTDALL